MNPVFTVLIWGGAFVMAVTSRRVRPSLYRINFIILFIIFFLAEIIALTLFVVVAHELKR